ncbi:MAG: hypothetical protein LBG92_00895 [Prevotellaceae bacterium]|jgi:hypothetical protein|nr:hypothetical protein [Prevotellaceae bacterium]
MKNKIAEIFIIFWKTVNLIVLLILIIICLLGTFYKTIAFGYGLGDLFMYIFMYFATFLHLILTIIFRKRKIIFVFLGIIFAFITIQICLTVTNWRNYLWNSDTFYLPCPQHYIEIKNQEVEKTVAVEMCGGEYDSEITAIWNGKLMKVENGNLLIPPTVDKYIKYPIDYIKIESVYLDCIKIESADAFMREGHKYLFNSDTLQISKKYLLKGKIERIENGMPVFRVRIVE